MERILDAHALGAGTIGVMITLTVRDETTAGEQLAALELQLAAEETTVRELIRARVHQEVRDHNATLR